MMPVTHGIVGRPDVALVLEANAITENIGDAVEFDFYGVAGDTISIDFGDGNPVVYNFISTGGLLNITGSSVLTNNISIVSSGIVTRLRFRSDVFTSINLTKSSTIKNLNAAFFSLSKMISFFIDDTSNVSIFQSAWFFCTGLTSFSSISLASATSLNGTFSNMTSLTSFPLLQIPSTVTDITFCWDNCNNLLTFPAIDFSIMTANSLDSTWRNCSKIVNMPDVISSTVIAYLNTWRGCSAMESIGNLTTSNATNFSGMFDNNTSLLCITAVDTTNNIDTLNMFNNTPLLAAPNATEQTAILAGSNYVNASPCP